MSEISTGLDILIDVSFEIILVKDSYRESIVRQKTYRGPPLYALTLLNHVIMFGYVKIK